LQSALDMQEWMGWICNWLQRHLGDRHVARQISFLEQIGIGERVAGATFPGMANSPLTISALDIAGWAASERARSLLPVLVRRLIHEAPISLSAINFPGYDEAQRPGWDGWTEANVGNAWVPAGASGWELSVAADNPAKPNRDWSGRIELPADDRATITFVFITAQRWPGKASWADTRRQENAWADVSV
jgi:hypothetical protein